MSIVSRGFKIFWWLIKFAFVALIAFICGFLLWRVFSSATPKTMETISVDDAVYEAYEEDGELFAFYQKQASITRAERNAGYFSVAHTAIIPEANQIQVVLRYNNSTIKHLVEDYSLETIPERSEDLYDVSLFFSVDLTPENTEDNDGKTPEAVAYERFFASDMVSAKKTLYNYRKFVFDDIKIDDTVIAVYADFYYVGDVNYDEKPYGSLLIYHNEEKEIKYSLTRDDLKAIEAYLDN